MREAIVHIGLNKTGSSTIQAWLDQNASTLLSQRIKYDSFRDDPRKPRHLIGLEALSQHLSGVPVASPVFRQRYGVASQEDQQRVLAEFQERFKASVETGDYDRYVLSSEALYHLGTQFGEIEPFLDFLKGFFPSVKFALYLRDQVDWYPSAYTQFIRTGGTPSIDEFIANARNRNYFKIANRWRAAVGAENLSVRLLERDFLHNGDLIEDFSSLIGADPAQTDQVRERNVGLSQGQLNTMRRLNQAASILPKSTRIKYQARLLSRVAGSKRTKKMTLSDDHSRQIAERHASSNERLRAQFFPEHPVLFKKSATILAAPSPAGNPAHTTPNASHATAGSGHRQNN